MLENEKNLKGDDSMLENGKKNPNVVDFILFNDSGAQKLHLTENDRPFPPTHHSHITIYSDEEKYEYKNDILIRWMTEEKFCPYRLFYKDIEVTKGKIKFLLDNGDSLIVESKIINRNISEDNKYDSFYGKKSILEHHCSLVRSDNTNYGWINEVTSYHVPFDLSECVHDGVTSFILRDYGIYQGDFESIIFEDVKYDATEVGSTFYFEYNDNISDEENIAD